MSPSNDDKKAQFEALTRKRQEMLDAEKKKRAEREASAAEVSKRQQKESQAESIAAKEHSAKREEWRQEKHDKQREDIEKKYKEKLEHERQEKIDAAKKVEDEKRLKTLEQLHRHSVELRVQNKIEHAKHDEEVQKQQATGREVRMTEDVDGDLMRDLEHIEREAKKKSDMLKADTERKRIKLEEELKQGGALTANRRSLLNLEESLQKSLFDIQTETKSLKAEATQKAEKKKQIARHEADKLRDAAEARREEVEEWFGRKDKKLIKDPLDLT